jgi:cardiolipin synthase
MTIPNLLTLSRIFLVPSFLIAVIYRSFTTAFSIFVAAGLTDFLDGFFARKLNQYSLLGTFLDPIADKLLMAVSYISLAVVGLIPPWLSVVVVFKDLFIVIGAAVLYFVKGEVNPFPTRWGKQSTFLQILTIAFALCPFSVGILSGMAPWLYWITAGMTVFSGIHYILYGVSELPPSRPLEKEAGKKKSKRVVLLKRRPSRKADFSREF